MPHPRLAALLAVLAWMGCGDDPAGGAAPDRDSRRGERTDAADDVDASGRHDSSGDDSGASVDTAPGDATRLCVPDSRLCQSASTALVCNVSGSAYEAVPCGEGETCQDGACRGPGDICAPGEAFCLDANQRSVCGADGSAWVAQACPSGELCHEGVCAAIACSPGSRSCDGNTVRECAADGLSSTLVETCEEGSPCQDGACLDPCAGDGKTYVGCEFWAADLDHMEPGDEKQFAVSVSNAGSDPVEITISRGDGTVVDTRTIAPGNLATVPLPRQDVDHSSLSRRSYLIESTGPVTAHQFNPLNQSGVASNDASLLLPSHAVGEEYMVVGWPSVDTGRVPHGRAYVTVVATVDDTQIDVTPTVEIAANGGVSSIAAGAPATFTIDRGEVLSLGTLERTGEDLTGTTLTSSAPVVVFSGHECADIPLGTCCCDHLEEQLFPLPAWGTTFVATKFAPRGSEVDIFRIVAAEDGTSVTLSPAVGGTSSFALARGEVRQLESASSFVVEASSPIAVAQFMIGASGRGVGTEFRCLGGVGDPAYLLAVPTSQYRTDYIVLTPEQFGDNFLSVAVPRGAVVTIDGSAPSAPASPVPGTDWAVITQAVSAGVHRVASDLPVGLSAHGYDCYVSYAYPGGLDLE